jgi:small subunit ribosomal protein S11
MAYKKKSKKTKRHVETAVAYITSTFNNTLVSITTPDGDVLLRKSAGALGFKGSRKSTPFAATQIGSTLAKEMGDLGVRNLEVNLCGPGAGRDAVVRAFQGSGIQINVLRDVTPLPHNGVRAAKKRRV